MFFSLSAFVVIFFSEEVAAYYLISDRSEHGDVPPGVSPGRRCSVIFLFAAHFSVYEDKYAFTAAISVP